MNRATVRWDNAQGRVETDPDTLRALRPLVAYQEVALPPPQAQLVIRGYMKGRRRYGGQADVDRLFDDPDVAAQLTALEWDRERLTPSALDAVLRMTGVWDGWTSLISAAGYFGAGLVPHVARALRTHLDISVTIVDERTRPEPRPLVHVNPPPLFPFQAEAIRAWESSDGRGVVNLPPRAGKTRIAIEAIRRLGLPALVVVPTRQLVAQTVEAFREWLPADQVVGVTGGRPSPRVQRKLNNTMVWVATPQTAAGPKPPGGKAKARRSGMDGIRSRKVLVIDEFHHSAAATYQDISFAASEAYYRLGLTGTLYRADGRDLAMHSVLSRCVYRRSVSEMVELGRLVPARVAMVRVPTSLGDVSGRDAYVAGVTANDYRNGLASIAAQWLVHLGKRVLVLVKEVAHAETLAAMIPGSSQVDGRDNAAVAAELERFTRGDIRCLIGTSVIGEGVDVPAADAIVYAAGGRSRVKVVQDYFRVLTASAGKTHGIVVDFADLHHPALEQAAARRLGMYRGEQAFVAEVVDPDALPAWLQANA